LRLITFRSYLKIIIRLLEQLSLNLPNAGPEFFLSVSIIFSHSLPIAKNEVEFLPEAHQILRNDPVSHDYGILISSLEDSREQSE
jgi:hypothetical protein